MAWDSDKSTAADPDNPQADEQLTADEWDNHVSEGHFPSDELNFGVDGNGDPVITDPQNGGQTVMRYDRSAGSWVVDALEADKADTRSGYNDVTSSRQLDTLETNNTGSDLDVRVTINVNADATTIGISPNIDGLGISQNILTLDSGDDFSISFTVPAGSTYKVPTFRDTADFGLEQWSEQS